MKILITESQLKYLAEQSQQKIKVTDKCGKTQEFNYQQWYYNGGKVARSDLKCYTWNGKSYVYNFSCHFKNWTSMNKQQRETAIAGVRKTCVGSYKEQPNLISLGVKEFNSFLKNVVWSNLTFDNIVEVITKLMEFVPPPYGGKANKKGIEVAHAISYYIRFIFSKDISEMSSNFVNAMFKFFSLVSGTSVPMLPGKVVGVVKKIVGNFLKIKDKILKISGFSSLSQWLQVSLTMIVELVGEKMTSVIQSVTENLLKPIIKVVAPINTSLSNIIGNLISSLNQMSINLKSAKIAANYLKQQDPNAFT